MMNPTLVILGLVAVAAVMVLVPVIASGLARFRRRKIVTCPETGKPCEVEVSRMSAGLSEFHRDDRLRLRDCDRWPERASCDQGCALRADLAT